MTLPAGWSSRTVDYSQAEWRILRNSEDYLHRPTTSVVQFGFKGSSNRLSKSSGAVFRTDGVNIRFADFNSVGTGYSKTQTLLWYRAVSRCP
jgi:hypothetical protein